MDHRKLTLTFAFILLSIFSYSQREELLFKHLTADDGLSHNSVYSINEDSLGFIWIGTRSGLNRFDGGEFKIYGNNHGLKNSYVNAIFKDSKGRIWVGTQEGGLGRYNYETDDFTSWSNRSNDSTSISQDNVLSIGEDFAKNIWVGTHDGGLNRYDEQKNEFVRIRFPQKTIEDQSVSRITAMFFENDSILWLGTYNGLFRYNIKLNRLFPTKTNGKFLDFWVTSFYNEDGRTLWIGTKEGLVKFDKISSNTEYIDISNSQLSSDLVTDLKILPSGRLMVATDGGGLNIVDLNTHKIEVYKSDPNDPYSLSNNSVYKIFIDRYDALWIGNYIGGINYYNKFDWKFKAIRHELNNPASLSDNHVRTFYEDRQGNIWIGTLGGFNLYDSKTRKFKSYTFDKLSLNSLSSNSVLSIYEDQKGDLWIGTFGGGICIFDKQKKSFIKYRNPDDVSNSLDKANIYCMVETNNKKLCIASLGGIYLIDLNSGRLKRFMSSNSKLSNNTIKALCKDRFGNIWIGSNRGLNRFDPESETFDVFLHSMDSTNSLSSNRVLTIYESLDGNIWIGTEGGGISIYNPVKKEFNTITTNDGLPDNVVNSIIQDNSGNFWISTNKGLVLYDIKKGMIRTYTIADGLQGNEFYQNAVLKSTNGNIYLGGPNGFNAFDPAQLTYKSITPKVILTDLYISNKPVRVKEPNSAIDKQLFLLNTITLPYQSNFEIHFAVLGMNSKSKYLCAYYLKGSNNGWTDYKNIRSAYFSNLLPGDYIFEVKAIGSGGYDSESKASIRIVILPPWWKTWWAFVFYAITLGSLLFIFMRINYLKVKAKHQLIAEIKEKEQLEELNSMKLRFFTDISHEFKTPLTLILGHLDNLKQASVDKRTETMNGIENNAKRLLMLINQLLEFRKAENGLMMLKASKGNIITLLDTIKDSFNELAEKKRIQFDLRCIEPIPELWFDSEKIEKIVFNLLSNAFKATDEGGSIIIELDISNAIQRRGLVESVDYLMIRVIDTGRGIAPNEIDMIFERFYHSQNISNSNIVSENSGIGLAYSKRLVDLHHGEISVNSQLGLGTTFTIKLPLGKDHLSNEEIKEESDVRLKMDYQAATKQILDNNLEPIELQQVDTNLPIMLIVDDNHEVCNVLMNRYKSNYYVVTAYDGESGFKKANRYLPDIVISDVMMPIVDGFLFCNMMKTNLITSHIPIILLTAKSGEENQISGMTAGADAYISKPYNPQLLDVTVQNLFQNRLLLRKKFSQDASFAPTEVVDNKIDQEFLNKIIARIENDQFMENIDVPSLCRDLAMSRSVLYRKIKMLTGSSIQEFVRVVKLRKAANLIVETTTPIAEIAYSTGFTNSKHFSTAFKKQFGKTPSEYRATR
jgi:signal transduction histidine kinase/ligand-binding sensor domain-containing protein/AraC-like DNA-binding protein/CheY-like chemotaxis protein